MYGKLFASCFTGSMYGAGPTVFAVWAYAIANADATGHVGLNPRMLAGVIGAEENDVEAALEVLRAPDERSRSQAEGGRRLLRDGQFQHRLVNYEEYREIANQEARRAYFREAKRRKRAVQD